MKKIILKNFREHWIVGIILILGISLRVIHYAEFPVLGETKDEYAWTFLGSSLLETGIPNSWSHFSAYTPFTTLTIGYDQFPMVKPALDHPPLFSFIPGIMHVITADNWLLAPSIKAVRFPMILLGGLNILLVYLIGMRFFNDKSKALIASVLYATIPSIVFGSRLVVAENLLVTWTLMSVWCVGLSDKNKGKFILLTVIGTFSILTKFSGIVVPFSIIVYGFLEHDSIAKKAGLLSAFLGVGLFMFYGWISDWEIFTQVFLSQSGRDVGLATLVNRFFLHPTIVNHIFLDGWIFIGLLSLIQIFTLSSNKLQNKKILQFTKVTVLLQLAFIATAVGETTIHGWYAYMLYPFFILGITQLFDEKQKFVWIMPFLWMFALPTVRMGLSYSVGLPSPLIMRVIIGFGFVPLFFSKFEITKKTLASYSLVALFAFLIVTNILTILYISDTKYWQDDEYFLPSRVVK